jgi:acyl-CoA synthetase (AMP-forming)/AMP-acid ligase II/thioesterase domain-containing protein
LAAETSDSFRSDDQSIPSTIKQAIERQCLINPDRPAIVSTDFGHLTYAELDRVVREIGKGLRAAGFGRFARVGVAVPSGPHAALVILSVSCSAIAIPLNPKQTFEEIEASFANLRPDCLLIWQHSECAARSIAERHGIHTLEIHPGHETRLNVHLTPVRDLIPAADEELDTEEPAFILQTSGTTSRPKLIPFSHRNMLAAAARLRAWFKLTSEDRCLSVSPVYYSHGLKVTVLTPLLTGGSVAFPTDAMKVDYREWFGALRPTWYSAGPTLHRMVFDQARVQSDPHRTHSLRFILSGGAPLQTELLAGLGSTFQVPVVEHYGSSEAAQIAANLPPPGPSKPGTVGVPWPDTLVVVGEEGNAVPPGTQGEVLVRGPTVIAGYLNAPELNSASFIDGWLRTGDIGSLDQDGFLTIHGRSNDLINRGGEKVSPIEVEEALIAHPAVADAAAFSVPHSRLGEDVAAAVVLRPGASADPHQLRTYLSEKMVSFKVPRRIVVVNVLPKGPTGKVLRRRLSETFGSGGSYVPSDVKSPAADLASRLTPIWERLLNKSPISIDDDFFEAGGDSLLAVQMLIELERVIGRPVPNSVLFETSTIRALTERLVRDRQFEVATVASTLSKSNRTPLVYFHGDPFGGRYVRKLANLLENVQAITVVSPHGLDDKPIPDSIEAMAADRLPSILGVQPRGPFRLGGYCVGGLVAFEAARLLAKAGEEVEVVILVDPPTINADPLVQNILSKLSRLKRNFNWPSESIIISIWISLAKFERYSKMAVSNKFYGLTRAVFRRLSALTKWGDNKSGLNDLQTESQRASPFEKYASAMSRYAPSPLPVPVVYFSSEYSGVAWRHVSPNLKMIELAGDHLEVLRDPSGLANQMRNLLEQA